MSLFALSCRSVLAVLMAALALLLILTRGCSCAQRLRYLRHDINNIFCVVINLTVIKDDETFVVTILAFVASYNQTMTHWYSKAVFTPRGQEIADGLKSCLVDSLTHYLRVNGKLPDRVIMYR